MRLQSVQTMHQIRRKTGKLFGRIFCRIEKAHTMATIAKPATEALNRQTITAAHGQSMGAN
jgi:hypothetical protein